MEVKDLSDCLQVNGHVMPVSVGSILFVGPFRNRGNHGAFVLITKVNNKTFKGVELKRSYTPGTKWTIHKESEFARVGKGEDGLMKQSRIRE